MMFITLYNILFSYLLDQMSAVGELRKKVTHAVELPPLVRYAIYNIISG